MTLFWTICGTLIALALAFAVLPLFRRGLEAGTRLDALNVDTIRQQLREIDDDLDNGLLDRRQYEAARRDLEKELLLDVSPRARTERPRTSSMSGRWMIPILGVALPAMAITVYSALGSSEIIPRLAAHTAPAPTSSGAPGDHVQLPPMEQLVERLAERLEANPDNADGWLMLGRSYWALGRPEETLAAYERALDVAPNNADVLLSVAQTLARTQGNRIAGRPAELISKALGLEPNNPNALWLAGMLSFELQNYPDAESRWQRLLPMLQPGSEDAAEVSRAIGEARARQGLGPATAAQSQAQQTPTARPSTPQQSAPTQAASSGTIRVRVSLTDTLAEQAAPTDRVFVFARASQGPRMPLAVASRSASELPVELVLSDKDAMAAGMKISAFSQIVVGARISRSGNAIPASGDLEGEVGPIGPAQRELVQVVIDRVRP